MFGRVSYLPILLLCFTAIFSPAMAQTDKPALAVGVVNFQTVLVESLAWQDFRAHIERESRIFEKNVNKMVAEIETLEKNIDRKGKHLSKQALRTQNNQLSQLRLRYQKQLQEQKDILDTKYVKAQDYLRQKIYIILQRISKEKNLPLILNAGTTTNAVLVADKQLDITNESLDLLNQEIPKLDDNFYRNLTP